MNPSAAATSLLASSNLGGLMANIALVWDSLSALEKIIWGQAFIAVVLGALYGVYITINGFRHKDKGVLV